MIQMIIFALIILFLFFNIRIVPQATVYIIESLGKYSRTLNPGLHVLIPVIDNIRNKVSLKEHVHDFAPQPVITKDNVTLMIDSVVYCKIVDPVKATYEIANSLDAIDKLTSTNLRAIVSTMDFDTVQSARDEINAKLLDIIDAITDPWGIDITRIEIQSVKPTEDIARALETQKQAEMEKKATILRAEAERTKLMTEAEGEKDAEIAKAEATARKIMLEAEAKAKAIELVANAEAEAIRKINAENPGKAYVELQAIKAMEKMNLSNASKIIVPSDLSALTAGILAAKNID